MPADEAVLANEHFDVLRLTDGIFAVVNRLEGGAMSNAGIVDLGNETLVFDALLTCAAASELRRASVELTGRPPAYVVNSHGHGDHVWGNSVFLPEATLLSSGDTAAMVGSADRASIDPEDLRSFIDQLKAASAAESDVEVRRTIDADLYARQWQLEELPLRIAPPTVTFEDRIWIRGAKRSVELVAVAQAHTAGDVYLRCPSDGILFMGGLGFFAELPPFIAPQGDAASWSGVLREFEGLKTERFVPGHGPVGDVDSLRNQRTFIDRVVDIAAEVARAGGAVEDATAQLRETEYAKWARTELVLAGLQAALDQAKRGSASPEEAP